MTLSLLTFRRKFSFLSGFLFLMPHSELFRHGYSVDYPFFWRSVYLTLKKLLNLAELNPDG